MSRHIIRAGRAVWRTKLMPADQAERFAACLQRHTRRFSEVAVRHSRSVDQSAICEFVLVHPTAECRRAVSWALAVRDRLSPWISEAPYLYLQDIPGACYWALNPLSGEAYQVTGRSCTCGHYRFRARHEGLRCVHSLALVALLETGGLPRLPRRPDPRCEACGAPMYPEQAADRICDECASLAEAAA